MIIEICGPGCPKCQATKTNVLKALQELGLKDGDDALVSEIKDFKMISARGVFLTPAVIIDAAKVCEGRVPGPEEVKKWIKERS
jgi:small redox-active disulfide protein 2